MKIVLINPPPTSEYDKHWARFPVLGIAYLAASLKAAGYEVLLLDGKLAGISASEIVDRAIAFTPGFIGITCMTVEFPALVTIAIEIKKKSDIPIIIGGAHVNAVKSQVLDECEHIDFACDGEGEV